MIIKTSYPFMKPPPSARLIRGHHLVQGLVFAPLLNENGGLQVFDSSEYGNTGTLVADTHFVSGPFGPTLDFDGVGDYVDFGNFKLIEQINDFTVSVWSYTDIANFASTRTIFSKSGSSNSAFYIIVSDNDNLAFKVWGAGSGTSNAPWVDGYLNKNGIWRHIVGRYSLANGAELFVDGILRRTAAHSGIVDISSAALRLGSTEANGWYWSGKLDLPMIWNRALSLSEIAELTYRPSCMFERKARTALMSGYEVVGGINYEDLLLGVSVNASVTKTDTQQMTDTGKAVGIVASILETDTQQMLDTEKDVSIAASVFETDTQQMLDTEKAVTFAASVSVTDILSGVVNYEDLLLGVSVSASVTEADIQQMLDTEKDVSIAASVSEVDTQQMIDTDLGVTVVASLNIADTQQMFDIDLPVSFAASITETDTQQMKDLLKDVTFAVSISETDTQQMKDLLKAVTFAASCGIETEVYYDASAVVVAMYAFIILRQHTS